MIHSVVTIGGHLIDRVMCDTAGSEMKMADLFPSMYQFRLKLYNNDDKGNLVEVHPNVTNLQASIGLVYAEPRAGTFKLRYISAPSLMTDAIDFRENPEDFKDKLGGLTGSDNLHYNLKEVYQPTPSTWMCRFDPYSGSTLPVPLEETENELEPETFVRFRQFAQGDQWWVEIRLMQGPIASTGNHESLIANAPTVSLIRAGYTEENEFETIVTNEIQAIHVPTDFTGTYYVIFDGRQSTTLSAFSGTAAIATALNSMYTDNRVRFAVSNPEANYAYVEFIGVFGGIPFYTNNRPLVIRVSSAGPPQLAFNLNLDTVEVAEALRTKAEIEAVFEVKLHITDPAIVPPAYDPGQDLILFQTDVTILRPLHWDGLEAAASINWLIPPNPVDYIPFDIHSVVTGSQTYAHAFGNGTDNIFTITHNLEQQAVAVAVRTNVTGSNRLLRDDEYSVDIPNANQVTITIPGDPPVAGSLIALVFAAGSVQSFEQHFHDIQQVRNLEALLNSMLGRIGAIEAQIATGGGGGGTGGTGPNPFGLPPAGSADLVKFGIPQDLWKVIPTNRPTTGSFDAGKLPSQGFLLPAVHEGIELGGITADPAADTIILDDTADTPLVNGQRVRFDQPIFSVVGGSCAFNFATNVITTISAHGMITNRMVKFSGGELPSSLSGNIIYYVRDETVTTFKIAAVPDGPVYPLITNGGTQAHFVSVGSEVPKPLVHSVDYFVSTLGSTTSTTGTFRLKTDPDPQGIHDTTGYIDILTVGFPPNAITTIEDAPMFATGILEPAEDHTGDAFSVREEIRLLGARGLRAVVVEPGDTIASDGTRWYQVTRSDSPGSNSFYPSNMESEVFRVATNRLMFPPGTIFTMEFELLMRLYKHVTNVQYLIVAEWADILITGDPAPTGPNIYQVRWNKVPIIQQRIIVTEIPVLHTFGAQVVHRPNGTLRSNKKIYGVQTGGDSIPTSPDMVIRVRLIEFDTEDNVKNAMGLVYYSVQKAEAKITTETPTPPTPP